MEKKYWPLTKSEIEEYLKELDQNLVKIYRDNERFLLGFEDSLDDSFQIAAAIEVVFEMYARRRMTHTR